MFKFFKNFAILTDMDIEKVRFLQKISLICLLLAVIRIPLASDINLVVSKLVPSSSFVDSPLFIASFNLSIKLLSFLDIILLLVSILYYYLINVYFKVFFEDLLIKINLIFNSLISTLFFLFGYHELFNIINDIRLFITVTVISYLTLITTFSHESNPYHRKRII
ncbi:hypothetical protein HMPREF0545_1402 [Ligilactobacillus salivarius DSM 20555 = ATCC 11741]|uniref:Uncharacterized protein n=1 Tax=Ligilactobacillus salivarius DSM 20555 = ATCC 11741 TaxID=1423799 RepID=C2EID0_9LACO|nr:hypothetical protein HMPREF0545_1402 [Ligilactobacillus salivarius DSM 20555 = ATCC 11741]KRM69032.1 hypothetical protein FC55_GL000407 [Ligilactobacillus salivarius DSM 20555 = ATCC 11741]